MLVNHSKKHRVAKVSAWLVLALVTTSWLSACGFHLRGNIPLSDGLKNMYVSAPKGSFKDLLIDRLEKLGVTIAETPAAADAILDIRKASSSRSVGTLDGIGKVSSYNIRFNVNYVLLDINESPIRPLKKLSDSRRYDFDPDQVVESESEEAELLEDIEQEVVLKIIRQLAAITDYDPNSLEKVPAEQKASAQN